MRASPQKRVAGRGDTLPVMGAAELEPATGVAKIDDRGILALGH
jgi:hypothetical protein